MKEWAFRVAVLVLLALIAVGLYLHSENGRYQFVKTDANEIVVDTRTGEYWVDANTHVSPRAHTVESRPPAVTAQKP